MATEIKTAGPFLLANYLKDPKFKTFRIDHSEEVAQGQLRIAAQIADMEYRELNLTNIYPMDLEETFKSLPDKPGVIIIYEYDQVDRYLQDLVNFAILYYEYRTMISIDQWIVPVSNKWKFLVVTKKGYWFQNTIVFKRAYHFSFGG